MAFDSSGNIAPKSESFINKLYATSTGESGSHTQRNWNSEIQRRYLKKDFLDSISLLQNLESKIYNAWGKFFYNTD
tara:strand:+ start:131 stop:358 length:228 start_codon:yes stop_codon:yes gene_type:complete